MLTAYLLACVLVTWGLEVYKHRLTTRLLADANVEVKRLTNQIVNINAQMAPLVGCHLRTDDGRSFVVCPQGKPIAVIDQTVAH